MCGSYVAGARRKGRRRDGYAAVIVLVGTQSDAAPAEQTSVPGPGVRSGRSGLAWIIGAFVFCPCHLPLTLAAIGIVLGGTAIGAAIREYQWVALGVTTAAWAIGTWRGFHLVRTIRSGTCSIGGTAGTRAPNGAPSAWNRRRTR